MSTTGPESEPRFLPPEGDDLWNSIRTPLLISIAAVVLIGGYATWSFLDRQKREQEAAALHASGTTAEIRRQVVERFPGSSRAAVALLDLAGEARNAADFAGAMDYYSRFVTDFPKHPARPGAELAVASCLEAQGKKEEALAAYERLIQARPAHPYAGAAALGAARIHKDLGRTSAARQVLNDFISQNTRSAFLDEARALLNQLPPS
jgi:TolA-binding protein